MRLAPANLPLALRAGSAAGSRPPQLHHGRAPATGLGPLGDLGGRHICADAVAGFGPARSMAVASASPGLLRRSPLLHALRRDARLASGGVSAVLQRCILRLRGGCGKTLAYGLQEGKRCEPQGQQDRTLR